MIGGIFFASSMGVDILSSVSRIIWAVVLMLAPLEVEGAGLGGGMVATGGPGAGEKSALVPPRPPRPVLSVCLALRAAL